MSDNFLREELSRCEAADKIIIGISGGADSVALTHILFSRLPAEKLICAHVNHGIRGDEAARDEKFVADFCGRLGLRLEVLHADVPTLAREWGMGEEECGRKVRYDFFSELADNERDIIVTAHNADDNAETILMNLVKGSGLTGLSGIPKFRGNIYRPILSLTRADIEKYCRDKGLSFVTDSSNLSTDYDRNKLRLKVIPLLKEINPSLVSSLIRSSELVGEADAAIAKLADQLLENSALSSGLDAAKLKEADEAVLKRALKNYFEARGCGRLEKKHIDSAVDTLRNSGRLSLPGNMLLTVSQGVLTLTQDIKPVDFTLPLSEGNNLLPSGKILKMECIGDEFKKNTGKINNLLFYNYADYDKIVSVPVATTRREGDRFCLQKRKVSKSLKKLMNELKIPAALRQSVVIVRDGDQIVFAEGIGVDERYKTDQNTVHAVKFSVIPGDEQ